MVSSIQESIQSSRNSLYKVIQVPSVLGDQMSQAPDNGGIRQQHNAARWGLFCLTFE